MKRKMTKKANRYIVPLWKCIIINDFFGSWTLTIISFLNMCCTQQQFPFRVTTSELTPVNRAHKMKNMLKSPLSNEYSSHRNSYGIIVFGSIGAVGFGVCVNNCFFCSFSLRMICFLSYIQQCGIYTEFKPSPRINNYFFFLKSKKKEREFIIKKKKGKKLTAANELTERRRFIRKWNSNDTIKQKLIKNWIGKHVQITDASICDYRILCFPP